MRLAQVLLVPQGQRVVLGLQARPALARQAPRGQVALLDLVVALLARAGQLEALVPRVPPGLVQRAPLDHK